MIPSDKWLGLVAPRVSGPRRSIQCRILLCRVVGREREEGRFFDGRRERYDPRRNPSTPQPHRGRATALRGTTDRRCNDRRSPERPRNGHEGPTERGRLKRMAAWTGCATAAEFGLRDAPRRRDAAAVWTPSFPAACPSVRGRCAPGGPVVVRCHRIFSSGFACMRRRSIGCRICRRLDPGVTSLPYPRPRLTENCAFSARDFPGRMANGRREG